MIFRISLLSLVVAAAIGCAPKSAVLPNPGPQKVSYFQHKVATQGETLGHIAQWYTGDWKNWEFIASHNPELNPNRIKVGDKVLIPETILVKRTPLPKEQILASEMRKFVGQVNGEKIRTFVSEMMSQFRPAE